MINAPYEKEFVFQDQSRAKNILELMLKLERIGDLEFSIFVNVEKNDFSNWIELVLNDSILASQLRNVHSKTETIAIIKHRMNNLAAGITLSHAHSTIEFYKSPNSGHLDVSNSDTAVYTSVNTDANTNNNSKKDISQSMKSSRNWFKFLLKKSFSKKDSEEITTPVIEQSEDSQGLKSSRNWFKFTSKKIFSQKNSQEISTPVIAKSEDSQGLKSSRNWFKFTSKKIFSQKDSEENAGAMHEEHKFIHTKNPSTVVSEKSEKDSEDSTDDTLWLVLYVSLIILIIMLLIYKFLL